MNRDVNDLKKWFKNLGLEIDGEIKDDDLKKYVYVYSFQNYLTIL